MVGAGRKLGKIELARRKALCKIGVGKPKFRGGVNRAISDWERIRGEFSIPEEVVKVLGKDLPESAKKVNRSVRDALKQERDKDVRKAMSKRKKFPLALLRLALTNSSTRKRVKKYKVARIKKEVSRN